MPRRALSIPPPAALRKAATAFGRARPRQAEPGRAPCTSGDPEADANGSDPRVHAIWHHLPKSRLRLQPALPETRVHRPHGWRSAYVSIAAELAHTRARPLSHTHAFTPARSQPTRPKHNPQWSAVLRSAILGSSPNPIHIRVLAHFSQADVFVMSKSAFSAVAALLNPHCVVYQARDPHCVREDHA